MNGTITIGLIDDHKMFLEGLEAILHSVNGFQVVFTYDNAKIALENIRKQTIPDVIITDISMPNMNGIEFIKALKKEFPEVKIIVLSMFSEIHTIENIDGYLTKDFDKEILFQLIKDIVLHHKKMQHNIGNLSKIEFNKSILSKREIEIIQLIAEEYTTDEIAEKLFISKGTVETHRKNIFYKLQVKNIAGLTKKAIYYGVLSH